MLDKVKLLARNPYISGGIFFATTSYYFNRLENSKKYQEISWVDLKSLIKDDKINKVELENNRKAYAYSKIDNKIYHMNISENNYIEKKIENIDSNLVIHHKNPSPLNSLLLATIPTFALMGFFYYMFRKNTSKGMGIFNNEYKIIEEKLGVKLKDIAGLHQTKQDVLEFSDIILNPEKYKSIGTKIPTGVLMEGPPGTGKTMLAKAIADNYNTKFFLINGSDFIQPIIGTGSRKVKELFETARKNSPSIIFIDEIDAIGKSRNMSKSIGNDERDNILNSLLVEMDGFNNNDKVLVMGATNRSDVLDKALLRPGRFDRVINFSLPDLNERKDILQLYYEKYNIDDKINSDELLTSIAKSTYGFNGADLQNLFNESSIRAIRSNRDFINSDDIDKSLDYIMLGNQKKNYLSTKEKEIVSYHESGHAVVSYLLKNVPSPTKLSIIPRSKGALGYMQAIPDYEKKLYTKTDLLEQIMVLMGGRVAEELIFDDVTNGAYDDIKKINDLAKNIVYEYGMGNQLEMINIDTDTKNNFWRKESEKKVESFDKNIDSIIKDCYFETKKLLNSNLDFLKNIQEKLYQNEVLNYYDIEQIYKNVNKI